MNKIRIGQSFRLTWKVQVNKQSVDAVTGYDYKTGYPEKMNFDTMGIKTIN